MKKILTICLASLVLGACNDSESESKETTTAEQPAVSAPSAESPKAPANGKLDQLSWFIGSWSYDLPDGTFTEVWEKTNDSLFTGHGMMVSKKGDTMFSEYIRIEQQGSTLYYKPIIKNQNGGKEVVFTATSLSSAEAIFENPAHNFPQKIVYQKPAENKLYARIEGKMDGKEMPPQEYKYDRKK